MTTASGDASTARPLTVGLTGGVASGKTTVASLFSARGVVVLDTDRIARDVVEPGSDGLATVVEAFGEQMLDAAGNLDRTALRSVIFSDPDARVRLEAIIHPLIRAELARRAARAGGRYQIHVIPLLVETGMQDAVDRVLVVDCPEPLQLDRLMRRDGSSEDEARRMLGVQANRQDRLAVADDVIVNDADQEQLVALVDRLHGFYEAIAGEGRHRAAGLRLP